MSRNKKSSKNLIDPNQVKEDINPSPLVRKLRSDIVELTTRNKQLLLTLGGEEDFFEKIKESLDSIEPGTTDIVRPLKVNPSVHHPMSVVLLLSDWHIGEIVEAAEIEGFNTFNWDIAKRRVDQLVSGFSDWVEAARSSANIDEVVIICVGDFVSGDIHEELITGAEFPAPVQSVKAAYLLSEAIAAIADNFNKVRVEFIVTDNHSRLTKKSQYKKGGYNSFNYIVGWITKERLMNLKNVDFKLHATIKALVDVQGFGYLCQHGHTIRGWSGFPWYGADRQVSREAKARLNMVDKQFSKMLIGHFHVPMNSQDFIVNGSLSGTTELDHGQGRHAAASQVAWLVHPKHGEFSWTPFWLDNLD